MTTAVDIANAVVWVSSPLAARQVTGQVIAVGGGSTMP
jgi:NAD(P)-dependent dehydrogenase (short-subunit alcohol dehydrogenase family)